MFVAYATVPGVTIDHIAEVARSLLKRSNGIISS